jgi:hypothetical protein
MNHVFVSYNLALYPLLKAVYSTHIPSFMISFSWGYSILGSCNGSGPIAASPRIEDCDKI